MSNNNPNEIIDKKTLLAIGLSLMIFVGWQKWVQKTQSPMQSQQVVQGTLNAQQEAKNTLSSSSPLTPSAQPTSVALEKKVWDFDKEVIQIENGNFLFSDWKLKDYFQATVQPAFSFNFQKTVKNETPVDLSYVVKREGLGELFFDSKAFAYLSQVRGSFQSNAQNENQNSATESGLNWRYEDENVALERNYKKGPKEHLVTVTLKGNFKKERPNYLFLSLAALNPESDIENQDRKLLYYSNNELKKIDLKDQLELKDIVTPVKWIGSTNRYFLTAFLPENGAGSEPKGLLQPVSHHDGRISLVYPIQNQSFEVKFNVYMGPKDLNVLRAIETSLDNSVDFGFFAVFAYPLLKTMNLLNEFFHNYGVSIILLTLLVKIITFPLTYKSMKSMKSMAKIQPQLQKIREKYKDDKEALNREMLSAMKTNGYNPVSGCLPMLIQMPIFFALYRVLYSSIELYQAPFMGWITDLSLKDPYFVTPVILTVVMYIQQKMTPNTATDPAQQKMMQLMPVIFGVFMISLPAGLTIYMLTNALASIVQQAFINRKLKTA